jgi:acyl carrier protein
MFVEFEKQITTFIRENLVFDRSLELSNDASLTRTGVIDSLGVLDLIMFLEETYGIKVADHETVPENLDTIANIVKFLESKVQPQTDTHEVAL